MARCTPVVAFSVAVVSWAIHTKTKDGTDGRNCELKHCANASNVPNGRPSSWGLAEELTPGGQPARKTFMKYRNPRTKTVHARHKKQDT